MRKRRDSRMPEYDPPKQHGLPSSRNLTLGRSVERFLVPRIYSDRFQFSSSVCDIFCRLQVTLDRFQHLSGTVLPFLQKQKGHEEDWDPDQYATIISDLGEFILDSFPQD